MLLNLKKKKNPLHNFWQKLTLVKEQDDLVESLEEVHVIVAVLLDLVEECELRSGGAGERREEGDVLLQVAERLGWGGGELEINLKA